MKKLFLIIALALPICAFAENSSVTPNQQAAGDGDGATYQVIMTSCGGEHLVSAGYTKSQVLALYDIYEFGDCGD
jgi:hypothetical protein